MPRKPNYDRSEMIDRARDLFWKKGWAGTSLKDLEAVLQMKPGSFYAAFGSKDALYKLAMEKYASDGLQRLSQLAEIAGPFKALQHFPQLVITNDNAPAKACMLSKTLLELKAQNNPLAHEANAQLLKMESRFAELFRQAQETGDIGRAHDPDVLARRYQSDILGLRVSADRDGVDALAIAADIADSLARLSPH